MCLHHDGWRSERFATVWWDNIPRRILLASPLQLASVSEKQFSGIEAFFVYGNYENQILFDMWEGYAPQSDEAEGRAKGTGLSVYVMRYASSVRIGKELWATYGK